MKQTSIKKQLFRYILTSFMLICVILVTFFFSKTYLEKKESLELEAKRLGITALKQTEQLVPGILVAEEYGSIELQLQKIAREEGLLSAKMIKPEARKDLSENSCSKLNPVTFVCYEVLESKLKLVSEINVASETLGFLVKEKELGTASSNSFSYFSILLVAITLIFIYLLISILVFVENHVRKPLLNLNDTLTPVIDDKSPSRFHTQFVDELQVVSVQVQEIIKKYEEKKAASVMIDVSLQVSHDIRSPLAALNSMLTQLGHIPEAQRVLMRSAIQRMNDIANQLLEKGKQIQKQVAGREDVQSSAGSERTLSTQLLSSLVDSILSEKRLQFREKQGVDIDSDLNFGYGLFVTVDATELKRIISNLLNNSVEALRDGIGRINVSLESTSATVSLIISDNGTGIPKQVLEKLGQSKISYGKENTDSGTGLGIYHAKTTIEDLGGKFKIESTVGIGTQITIEFPKSQAPLWFVEKLVLHPGMKFVTLDDDISINQVWKSRLEKLSQPNANIDHITFTSGSEFRNWVKTISIQEEGAKTSNILYLVDYELLNQNVTGLGLIEELGIAKQAVLVTSRYEEAPLRERCSRIGTKLIPKTMAGFVPMEIKEAKQSLDGILIDDDQLVHATWKFAAQDKKKSFAGFYNHFDFLESADQFDVRSKIYVDSNLGNGIRGEEIAKQISEMGFENIYLCTGYQSTEFGQMPWIKDILGKDPQF